MYIYINIYIYLYCCTVEMFLSGLSIPTSGSSASSSSDPMRSPHQASVSFFGLHRKNPAFYVLRESGSATVSATVD